MMKKSISTETGRPSCSNIASACCLISGCTLAVTFALFVAMISTCLSMNSIPRCIATCNTFHCECFEKSECTALYSDEAYPQISGLFTYYRPSSRSTTLRSSSFRMTLCPRYSCRNGACSAKQSTSKRFALVRCASRNRISRARSPSRCERI